MGSNGHNGKCKVVVSQNGVNSYSLVVMGYGDKLPKNEQALRHACQRYADTMGLRPQQLVYSRDDDVLTIQGIPASLVPAMCSPHKRRIGEVDFSQLFDRTARYRMHEIFRREKTLVRA